MSAYLTLVETYVNNFLNQMAYISGHLSSFPGFLFFLGMIVIMAVVGLLKQIVND